MEELTCCICDEVKGLHGFSKVQRRDPDRAVSAFLVLSDMHSSTDEIDVAKRCLQCVMLHVNTEPGVTIEEEEEEDSDDDSNPYESDFVRFSQSHRMQLLIWMSTQEDNFTSESGVALNDDDRFDLAATGASEDGGLASSGHGKENMRSDNTGASASAHEGSIWLEQGRKGWSDFSGVGIPFTGYDSQGLAHAQFRAPSTTASEQSWGAAASTGSSLRSSQIELTKSGFAKTRVITWKLTVTRLIADDRTRGARFHAQRQPNLVFSMTSLLSIGESTGQPSRYPTTIWKTMMTMMRTARSWNGKPVTGL